MLPRVTIASIAVAASVFLGARAAHACRVLEVRFNPSAKLQIAVWIERADGACMNAGPSGTDCVETVYVTRLTGAFGIGNRPGMMDFNSGYRWPYGRRTSVLPVWAHARAHAYPRVVFQDGQDRDLAHSPAISSRDSFCRPMSAAPPDLATIDTMTCATTNVDTDKGRFDPAGGVELYPPRADLNRDLLHDSADVDLYPAVNDIDALASATPDPSIPYLVRFSLDDLLARSNATDFIVRIEVNQEFDQNATWNFPSPTGISYADYGFAYRGQPSVVYEVPVHAGLAEESWQTLDYAGYGSPDGSDGLVRPSDMTVDTADGTGAGRLLAIDEPSNPEGPYRFRVTYRPVGDTIPPNPVGLPTVVSVGADVATVSFVSPGDDGATGNVAGYVLRLMAGTAMSAANFDRGASPVMRPVPAGGPPGQVVTVELDQLSPSTDYDLGVRAQDDCTNLSDLVVLHFTTRPAPYGTVPPCGCGSAPGSAAPTALLALGLLLVARRRPTFDRLRSPR